MGEGPTQCLVWKGRLVMEAFEGMGSVIADICQYILHRKPIFPQSSLSSNLKAPEFVLPGFQVPPEHHPQRPCSLHQAEAAAFGPLHCMEWLQNRHLAERFSCTVPSGEPHFQRKESCRVPFDPGPC